MTNEHWDKVHARAEKFFADNDKEMNGLDDIQKATNFAIAELASAVPAGEPTAAEIHNRFCGHEGNICQACQLRKEPPFTPSPATGQPPRCEYIFRDIGNGLRCDKEKGHTGDHHATMGSIKEGIHVEDPAPAAVPAPDSPLPQCKGCETQSLDAFEHDGCFVDKVVDREQARWQKSLYELSRKHAIAPNEIDGSGCDSGDPLDLTLAEVGQVICQLENPNDYRAPAEPVALEEVARESCQLMDVMLNEPLIAEIKRLTPEGGKELGCLRLRWNGGDDLALEKVSAEIAKNLRDKDGLVVNPSTVQRIVAILSRSGAGETKGAKQ